MEARKLSMKVKRVKKNKAFKKTNTVDKKILPQHSKCESKFISSNRLTRKIGLYNQGKISYLVSRCEEISSPGMKARVQQDLHKILNLEKNYDSTNGAVQKSVSESQLRVIPNPKKKARQDKYFDLSPPIVKDTVEMDIDDPSPELTLSTTAILKPRIYLKNASSVETARPSPLQGLSNLDNLFSLSSKPENTDSLETKMRNPKISDFVDHCINIWASRLLPEIQPINKDKGNEMLTDVTLQYKDKVRSGPSTSRQTATKAVYCTRAITSSSEDEDPFTWPSCKINYSSPLKKHNKQGNLSQDIDDDCPLNCNRLCVNSSSSSLLPSSETSDYENAEVWSSIDDDISFVSCENSFELEENSRTMSPSVPPKVSPVKRPSEKVETPKLFFRYKLY